MSDKKTWKSAQLRESEKNVQMKWKINQQDITQIQEGKKSYFATFPYPYMNGYLHLGHAYTMSKQDFACRYHRMIGCNILEPFSFHLTGMPIVAAADKLKKEIEMIKTGSPISKITTPQYETMIMMQIPQNEIEKFTNPSYWGKFFPQVASKTLKRFGIGYDETRSFITTNENPFYDSFIKWQFGVLFKKNVLRFGSRYCIYSLNEKQPCLGHDRSVGEDAKPKKYWFVPYQLHGFDNKDIDNCEKVYLVATTSRPETLYGVTNLWIGAEIGTDSDYNLYYIETKTGSMYWIIRNLALDGLCNQYRETDDFYISSVKNHGKVNVEYIASLKAIDHYNNDQLIPIISTINCVDRFKGSGTLPSVPGDDPDDNGIISRKKLQITPRKCMMYNLPEYQGNCVAVDLVGKMNDIMIKNICYNRSNECVMTTGEFKGMTVTETRNKMERELITYYEPDIHAFSRSGYPLIVAKADQWYIDYGDQKWKDDSLSHVEHMTFSDPIVKDSLTTAINWLDQWPCSRTYGMGSNFPSTITDADFLIDSLSDSTIYMALYTIYHYFSKLNIDPLELTEQVWDYIFLLKDYDDESLNKYKPLREEFMYWYPMDLRVSAKDLIPNHLAMSIFNHVMIWDDEFKQRLNNLYPGKNNHFGPLRYEINGYITVQKHDSKIQEKMSKSKGNFKTLDQAIDMYSADAVRFTFASASGKMDDSYFDQDLCTKMIEKLHKEKEWMTHILIHSEDMSTNIKRSYPEQIFINEMNQLVKETVKAYNQMDYRSVTTIGFHMMQKCRDTYLEMASDDNYNYDVLVEFIKIQLILMYPIIPHFSDHFQDHFAGRYTLDIATIDRTLINMKLQWTHYYVNEVASDISKRVMSLSKKKPITKITIYVTGEVTDPIEIVIRQLINEQLLENKELIDEVTKINNVLTKDNKSTGQLIKYYKNVKELIMMYGIQMYENIIKNKEEYNALKNYLKYYLRFKKSDNIGIEIIEHTKENLNNIHNVRTLNPVIHCD